MKTILSTKRLVLTELAPADAPFILELVNSAGWLQFIGDRNIKDIAAAEQYIVTGPMASYAKHGYGLYLVTCKETGPVGICGLIKRETLEQADIGYALLPQYTGHGYALEAAAAVVRHAKETLALPAVLAITLEDNHRSIQLLLKLGMVFQKKIQLPPNENDLLLFSTV